LAGQRGARQRLRAVADGGLGFQGLVVTDGMEMRAISAGYGIERGSVLAVAAGADAICVGGGLADEETVLRLRDALVAAVRSGELPEERLADAASRVRALAEWAADTRRAAAHSGRNGVRGPVTPRDPEVGLAAARRALRVTVREGAYEPMTTPPYVAAFTPVANIAVGDETPWGIAAELERLLPGTTTGTFGPAGGAADESAPERAGGAAAAASAMIESVLAAAADRRIVAVVRDVHRHRWMGDALDALLAARPDTVVVEMGLPGAAPAGALHIATHGAARVCGRAAAEVVAGGQAEG
ncbi:glycoside hydrolase family 3 N-terminal domain-containing protein, partial [Streptomyces sp. NPDC048845]|uniref:glycoside hydrolase family 3 N-terminal domain-containing protein n=1 Tax=Streptomyces sp. NPDC048845 TaxID=3155390 RepID=UPI003442CDDB